MTGVILMYHRVADVEPDAYGLAVPPDVFADQAAELARMGCVVPLPEIDRPGAATRVAITFDDGYADNARTAAPLLSRSGLPATFFITTGRLGGRSFWWDRLATALLGAPADLDGLDVTVDGRRLWLALDDPGARRTALRFVHRRLRPLPPDVLGGIVDDLVRRSGAPEAPADELSMTVPELLAMAALPHVSIGGHTRTHLQLGGQAEALQRSEVLGSLSDLAELLGRPVDVFAYPFGSLLAVGELAPRLAHEAGCVLACSTVQAPVRPGTRDRYVLPRLDVKGWSGAELRARIERLAAAG